MELTVRRLWIQVHLVIGLTAGAVFVVMGLSGGVLVFHQGLDRWLNPKQLTASSGETWKPLDELVAAAQGAETRRTGPAALEWPWSSGLRNLPRPVRGKKRSGMKLMSIRIQLGYSVSDPTEDISQDFFMKFMKL
jgi:uncharacterized iron-regulated membrane protein